MPKKDANNSTPSKFIAGVGGTADSCIYKSCEDASDRTLRNSNAVCQ